MIKKTYNINLAGRQFVIDDDAYTLANNYLDTIEHLVRDPEERSELTSDIEDRMSELLTSYLEEHNLSIVTREMVERVISRIGQPDDFIEIETEEIVSDSGSVKLDVQEELINETNTDIKPGPAPQKAPGTDPQSWEYPGIPAGTRLKRRLFRDPKNAIIGGVCSGIAHYLRIDPIWIRLGFVLLAVGALQLVSFTTMIFIYVLLWIIVPAAETPLQRLQMMGEAPTLQNIARTVTNDGSEPGGEVTEKKDFWSKATGVINSIGKGLMLFFGVVAVPVSFILMLGVLGIIFVLIMFAFGIGWMELDGPAYHETLWGLLTGLGSCLTLLIPSFLCLWYLIKQIRPNVRMSRTCEIILAVIWIIAFIFTAVCISILNF